MKLFTVPLPTLLVVLSLNHHAVHSQTLVDLALNIVTETLPCFIPCAFEHRQDILDDILNKCSSNIITKAQELSKSIGDLSIIEKIEDVLDLPSKIAPLCGTVRELTGCSRSIFDKYCGAHLTEQLISHVEDALEYLGCGSSTKANLLKCFAKQESLDAIEKTCIPPATKAYPDVVPVFQGPFNVTYNTYLSQEMPDICMFGNSVLPCAYRELEKTCGLETVQDIKTEVEALKRIINCAEPSNPYYDSVRCLSNPSLNQSVVECVTGFDYANIESSMKNSTATSIIPEFDVRKLCDIVNLMDSCYEDKIKATSSCKPDGWTITNYKKIVTPSRDYLLEKACGRKPSGDGRCPKSMPSNPAPEGDPNKSPGTKSGINSSPIVSAQYLSTCLCLMVMWIFEI